jgi:hypothetical protein
MSVRALTVLEFCDSELVSYPRYLLCYGPPSCKGDWLSPAAANVGMSERCQSGHNQRSSPYVNDADAFRGGGLCIRGDRRCLDYPAFMSAAIHSILLVRKIHEEARSSVTMPSNKLLHLTPRKQGFQSNFLAPPLGCLSLGAGEQQRYAASPLRQI